MEEEEEEEEVVVVGEEERGGNPTSAHQADREKGERESTAPSLPGSSPTPGSMNLEAGLHGLHQGSSDV